MGAAQLLPAFGAPDWSVRFFVLVAIPGLPMAIVLAWAYQITPRGIQRDQEFGANPGPEQHGRAGDNTTMLLGSQGTVRVRWMDGAGPHEKIFHRSFRMGRAQSCEIQLDDPMISQRQAEVSHSEGLWWIQDLGSRNGTTLDGRSVSRVPLRSVCEVKLYEAAPTLPIEVKASRSAPTDTASRLPPPRAEPGSFGGYPSQPCGLARIGRAQSCAARRATTTIPCTSAPSSTRSTAGVISRCRKPTAPKALAR